MAAGSPFLAFARRSWVIGESGHMEVNRQMSPVRSSLVVVIGTTTLLNSSLILNSLLATDVRNGLRTLCRFPGEDGPHQIARIDGGGGQWPGETLDGGQLPGRSALPLAP